MMLDDKQALISKLKKDLLSWQGVAQSLNDECAIDLGPLEKAFPNGSDSRYDLRGLRK